MMTLTLEAMNPTDSICLGPAPYFKVSGSALLEGPSDSVRGHHATGFWVVQGKFFTVYEINGTHFIHFLDGKGKQSERYGPFATTRVADGHIAAPGLRVRYLDNQNAWECATDNTVWPEIVFTVL